MRAFVKNVYDAVRCFATRGRYNFCFDFFVLIPSMGIKILKLKLFSSIYKDFKMLDK